jgi:general secretion pathway protein G
MTAGQEISMKRTRRACPPGFSLIELMLVIAIIATLTAVVAIRVASQGDKAKRQASIASMTVIKTALESYNLDQSAYPPNLKTLVNAKVLEDGNLADGWKTEFYYQTPGLGDKPYQLISFGADKQATTADDIDVWTMNK